VHNWSDMVGFRVWGSVHVGSLKERSDRTIVSSHLI